MISFEKADFEGICSVSRDPYAAYGSKTIVFVQAVIEEGDLRHRDL